MVFPELVSRHMSQRHRRAPKSLKPHLDRRTRHRMGWRGKGWPEAACSQNRLTKGEVKQGCFAGRPSCLSTLPLFGAMSCFPTKDALRDSNAGAGVCSQPPAEVCFKSESIWPRSEGHFQVEKNIKIKVLISLEINVGAYLPGAPWKGGGWWESKR